MCENRSHSAQFCGTAHPFLALSLSPPCLSNTGSPKVVTQVPLASRGPGTLAGVCFTVSGTVADAQSEGSCRAKGRALSALHSEPHGLWGPGQSENVELPFTRQGNVSFFHGALPTFHSSFYLLWSIVLLGLGGITTAQTLRGARPVLSCNLAHG